MNATLPASWRVFSNRYGVNGDVGRLIDGSGLVNDIAPLLHPFLDRIESVSPDAQRSNEARTVLTRLPDMRRLTRRARHSDSISRSDPPRRYSSGPLDLERQNGAVDDSSLAAGLSALEAGRWMDARIAFESALAAGESGEAYFGLATALWWLGDSNASVGHASRAYVLFREASNVESAVQCAVWLGITYKANFANFAAANGWIGRAERLLAPLEPGLLHGWVYVARAYRMPDLVAAETLSVPAVELGRVAGDADLELVAMSQLGLIRVGQGHVAEGFALIDEAMAAALAGERSNLDTVVYTCCDMLNACELASDLERAAQWCRVADEFVENYGCPFLYAECRLYYGSVLVAKGRWDDADRELTAGVRITAGTCPGLHARALTRLARLRVRQGRLEDAALLLSGVDVDGEAEAMLSLAAMLIARGDTQAASRQLEDRLQHIAEHRFHLATALDLLVDACLRHGDVETAGAAADRLGHVVGGDKHSPQLTALAACARGRVLIAQNAPEAAAAELNSAVATLSRLELPFERAHAQYDLGRALVDTSREAAIDHLRRSLTGFEELGAALDADRVAAFLRTLGVPARTGAKGAGQLTDREQQVLRLLSAGLSNPEIAQRLHISRKTAAHHVSHILTKLNLRNRAEIVAYAMRETAEHH
jgi:DNA-binding CsgD family transcriptional regulator